MVCSLLFVDPLILVLYPTRTKVPATYSTSYTCDLVTPSLYELLTPLFCKTYTIGFLAPTSTNSQPHTAYHTAMQQSSPEAQQPAEAPKILVHKFEILGTEYYSSDLSQINNGKEFKLVPTSGGVATWPVKSHEEAKKFIRNRGNAVEGDSDEGYSSKGDAMDKELKHAKGLTPTTDSQSPLSIVIHIPSTPSISQNNGKPITNYHINGPVLPSSNPGSSGIATVYSTTTMVTVYKIKVRGISYYTSNKEKGTLAESLGLKGNNKTIALNGHCSGQHSVMLFIDERKRGVEGDSIKGYSTKGFKTALEEYEEDLIAYEAKEHAKMMKAERLAARHAEVREAMDREDAVEEEPVDKEEAEEHAKAKN
ncbi:hypothetical protein BDV95DRAFT_647969 [Massariosphaeria phaeospora]|uniref:Uncharacterized protein n=1 Tax=Massariosphaeria phaeospora TaxID=100035 RepID=A0A7C8M364_9PLEO|nr:hypothetical protein BDV95DRAFT_647969 [Massariosphaeria phaeospora]